jgi:hypothetical protein
VLFTFEYHSRYVFCLFAWLFFFSFRTNHSIICLLSLRLLMLSKLCACCGFSPVHASLQETNCARCTNSWQQTCVACKSGALLQWTAGLSREWGRLHFPRFSSFTYTHVHAHTRTHKDKHTHSLKHNAHALLFHPLSHLRFLFPLFCPAHAYARANLSPQDII